MRKRVNKQGVDIVGSNNNVYVNADNRDVVAGLIAENENMKIQLCWAINQLRIKDNLIRAMT